MKKRPIIIFKIYTKFIINVSWLLISTDREMKAQRLKMFLMYLLLFSYAIKYLFLMSSSHLLNCTPVVLTAVHTAVHTAVQSRTCSSLCYLRVVSTSNFLPAHTATSHHSRFISQFGSRPVQCSVPPLCSILANCTKLRDKIINFEQTGPDNESWTGVI